MKTPSLQQRVVAEVDSGHDIAGQSDLLGLGQDIVGIAVETIRPTI